MKKLIRLFLATLFVVGLTSCSNNEKKDVKQSPSTDKITINFKIVDVAEDKVLFEGPVEVSATCETMADVLTEAEELNVVTEEGAYGLTILSILDVGGDWDKGPWWVYESSNNESCVKMGFCDGISSLKIADQDEFLFKLTSEF